PFLRRDAAKKGEVLRLDWQRPQQLLRKSVIDGPDPTGLWKRPALGIRNRNDRHRREGGENRLVIRQIEATMKSGHERNWLAGQQRERIVVQMERKKIELLRPPPHLLQHQHMECVGVSHRSVEAQRPRPRSLKLC